MKKYSANKYTQKKSGGGVTLRNGKPVQNKATQGKKQQPTRAKEVFKAPQKEEPESEDEESEDDGIFDDEFDQMDSESDGAEVDEFEGDELNASYDDGEVEISKGSKRSMFDSESEEEEKQTGKALFSDENKSWLKQPKKQKGEDEDEDEDEDEEGEDKLMDIEVQTQKLEEKQRVINEEAEQELKDAIERERFELSGQLEVEDLSVVSDRLRSIVQVLADFKTRKEPGKSRPDYIAQLKKDIATYYGYTDFLIELYFSLFNTTELVEHLEANETPRPTTIRVNTLKARRKELAHTLISKGVNLDPIKWSKVGLVIYDSQVPIGATAEYLSGQYMLQSAASFLPVMALNPQPNEKILDMCAAPGGKSTFIAALMKNTGTLLVNDVNKDRLPSLVGNIHRMGVHNSVVINMDGRKISAAFGRFDRVLLDAPCMGLGVISKDTSIKSTKYEADLDKCTHLQKELILAAIDSLQVSDKSGVLVYSTCSVTVEENEAVVDYAIQKRFVKVIETGLGFGVEGITNYRYASEVTKSRLRTDDTGKASDRIQGKQLDKSIKLARRFYPQTHNVDGFFVCKLKKVADGPRTTPQRDEEVEEESNGMAEGTLQPTSAMTLAPVAAIKRP